MLRSLLHLQHPSSPLSSPGLVHGAFFTHKYPWSDTREFMRWMSPYECMGWPIGQMGHFAAWWQGSSTWLNVKDILRNISAFSHGQGNDSVCVMSGSEDVLMDVSMCEQQTADLRNGLRQLRDVKKLEALANEGSSSAKSIDGMTQDSADGVRLVVVQGAGHHLQNDLQRDIGAEALLQFVRQA